MSQFGLVGPSYEAANPNQDAQRLINWYPEIDRTPKAKTVIGLLGCPGLVSVNAAYSGEVRGAWVLPGGRQAMVVIGQSAVLMTAPSTVETVGTLQTTAGAVGIRDNGVAMMVVIADGQAIYAYSLASQKFSMVNLAADTVAFIDGWLIFNEPSSQQFFASPLYWNGTNAFDPTYFALKDVATDRLVGLIESKRELLLLGERRSEFWVDAGGATFPFSRLQGAVLEIGCAAAHSVANHSRGVIFLARNECEGLSVVLTEGYDYKTVSTPAVQFALGQYATVSDAIGWVYKEEGHKFYQLTFPTEDVTWVLDLSTHMWHQRASYDPVTGVFHRARANCYWVLAGVPLVGDYQSGVIWHQTRKAFSDGANPLVAVRRSPHVWDEKDRARVTQTRLQVEFTPGQGLAVGQGSDPQMMLRWSNDGGQSWKGERSIGIGKIGETTRRAVARRLGAPRDRLYEVSISDPVNRDVVGASLSGGENAS